MAPRARAVQSCLVVTIDRVTALALVAVAVLLGSAGPALGADRADMKVTKGSVEVKGGELKGSFVMRNAGDARSKRSTALLNVVAGDDAYLAESYRQRPLRPSDKQKVKVKVALPAGVPDGAWPIQICADGPEKIRERSERNNCRTLGEAAIGGGSSIPTDPIPFDKDVPFQLASPESPYWIFVPSAYDGSHMTPTKLFVWMHGCGGDSGGDIYTVSPGGAQDWISVSLGGRDGACWSPDVDQAKVLAAVANVKTHFNIAARQVIIGGYSSGGDLAYRTAFYNSRSIAGVLAADTSPFRDTGSTQQASLAAAESKFDVVHLAHLQDDVYPIAGVRAETNAMTAAGFPLTRLEVRGDHYNNPGDVVNGSPVPGTDADIQSQLLPHIGDGWISGD